MTSEQPDQRVTAAAEKVVDGLRAAWRRMTASQPEGNALVLATRQTESVKQKLDSELYTATVRAVEAEVAVERLELELASARADIERLTMSELKARQRAGQEERAAFEAALKPMSELGQSLIKWAESWGQRLQAELINDLDQLSGAMQPLADGMRETYRDAGAPYGDDEAGMLHWWTEQADRISAQTDLERNVTSLAADEELAGEDPTASAKDRRGKFRRSFGKAQS